MARKAVLKIEIYETGVSGKSRYSIGSSTIDDHIDQFYPAESEEEVLEWVKSKLRTGGK